MSNTNNNIRQLSYNNNNSPSTNYSNDPNVKRKRGRPRKYPADVSVSPLPPPGSTAAAGDGGYSSPAGMSNSGKKSGRPPMSLNKQHHPAASGLFTLIFLIA
nr:hypothetical protein [Tanacetum cinerariifolium]